MSDEMAALDLGGFMVPLNWCCPLQRKSRCKKIFHLRNVYDSSMVLPFVTTGTAAPDIIPNEVCKRG